MHPTQVGQWKRELQAQAAGLFEVKRVIRPTDPSASPDRLYSEIGRLKMELDWLKKSPGPAHSRPLRQVINDYAVFVSSQFSKLPVRQVIWKTT